MINGFIFVIIFDMVYVYFLVELKISCENYFMFCEISKIILKNFNLIKKGIINIVVDGSIYFLEIGNYDLIIVIDVLFYILFVGEFYVCCVLMILVLFKIEWIDVEGGEFGLFVSFVIDG